MESKIYTYKCAHCGKEFTAKRYNARFCSKSCCAMWNRQNKRAKRTTDSIEDVLQIVNQVQNKDVFLELGNNTNALLENEQQMMEKLSEFFMRNWIPNKAGTGGLFDLSCIGGKGMLKIEFINQG